MPSKSQTRIVAAPVDSRPRDPAFSEATPYAPNSPYAASKAASDHLVRAYRHTYGLPTLTTNCSNNYGPRQFPEKLIPLTIHNALAGKPLPVYGDGLNIRDIELGPLTPYSGKYVGYAIEKGKMSFDVAYKVEHRKLTAVNRLVLNQLTFGGRIESPQATKLPVLLAVSLLKDRNGMIDVNLPISGSLDDPKFSIGGIVWHIIFNLIEKAVTSPFALIGNLVGGGGGEEECHRQRR